MKDRKIALVLSVVLIVALLAVFEWSELMVKTIPTMETETLETIRWKCEKPTRGIDIGQDVSTQFVSSEISAELKFRLYSYFPDSGLDMDVEMAASNIEGYVRDIYVSLEEDYAYSTVFWSDTYYSVYGNLSVLAVKDSDTLSGAKAFFGLANVNQSKQVYLRKALFWGVAAPYNHTSLLKASFEFTYFNGTFYKKVIQPFEFKIMPDDNNSFETAEEVHEGKYSWLYVDCTYDNLEYYKIYVAYLNHITVNMTNTTPGVNFNLYLYEKMDANYSLVSSSEKATDQTEMVVGNESHSGGSWWYIQVNAASANGFYDMSIALDAAPP